MSRPFKSERHLALSATFPANRVHSQAYRPSPARRINPLRRLLRAFIGAIT